MSRNLVKTIKTISNEPEEYICDSQKDLSPTADKLEDRPFIFVGKALNRDQQWEVQDIIELKEAGGVRGMGKAFKYMWTHNILEVRNVLAPGDVFKGAEKDALWDSLGMEKEMNDAITHFYTKSSLTENESKT